MYCMESLVVVTHQANPNVFEHPRSSSEFPTPAVFLISLNLRYLFFPFFKESPYQIELVSFSLCDWWAGHVTTSSQQIRISSNILSIQQQRDSHGVFWIVLNASCLVLSACFHPLRLSGWALEDFTTANPNLVEHPPPNNENFMPASESL